MERPRCVLCPRRLVGALGVIFLAGGLALGPASPADPPAPAPLTAAQKERLQVRDRWQAEAMRLFGEKKIAEGVAAFQKKIAVEREVYGAGHGVVLASLEALAKIHEQFED